MKLCVVDLFCEINAFRCFCAFFNCLLKRNGDARCVTLDDFYVHYPSSFVSAVVSKINS